MSITPCGYAVGRAIFTPTDIAQMQTGITHTLNRLAGGFLTPYETSCPDAPFAERLERIAQRDRAYAVALIHGLLADAHRDPHIAALAEHPRLREAVRTLIAPREITGEVIRVRVNLPSFPQTRSPWHQDATDHRSPVTLACWIPLVDATAENGTLEVLPGEYAEPYAHQQTADGKFYLPQDVLPDTLPQTLPCPAGDVLFLDRFLPHRTLPNQTTTVRWSLVMWVKGQRH
ncbi:MAG: phytanoyl-CoA dioxygenase family protein [Candidatus Tectimicrobiota bacterium]